MIPFPAPTDNHASGDELPERKYDDHAEDDDGGESDDAVEPVQVAVVEHLVELPGDQAHLVRQKLFQARNLKAIDLVLNNVVTGLLINIRFSLNVQGTASACQGGFVKFF